MSNGSYEGFKPLNRTMLERQIRDLANRRSGAGIVDDLELQHLVSVILHGALLLHDLYSSERIGTVYAGDPRSLVRSLVGPLVAEAENSHEDLVARVGRLPEQVRLLGDKCLFDVGITRIRHYKGIDLQDLGVRAYKMASEILDVLAEDGHLRDLFDRNRLIPLSLTEEVTFLKQCAERFGIHAELLLNLQFGQDAASDSSPGLVVPSRAQDRVIGQVMAAPAELEEETRTRQGGFEEGAADAPDPDGAAPDAEAAADRPAGVQATGSDFESLGLSREDLLSCYERIVLFASLDLKRLKDDLNAVVVDQPEAVEALCDEFALYSTGTHSLTRPPSYFFVGPTGVGKNHLVESLVRLLGTAAGVEVPLLTIDGPNYTDPSDINELRGSTRGFVRSDEDGVLAEFHQRSSHAPLSVILVDEVEKAHPHLRKFFLSLMDRGTVTDNRGRTLFFANSMIVFTSNLGFSEAARRATPIGYRGEESREIFEKSEVGRTLRQALSAEFVNRLRIIRFDHLSGASIERIFQLEFDKVRRRFLEVHGVEIVVTERAKAEILARGYSYDFGARHLAGVVNRVTNVEVSKRLKRDEATGPRSEQEILDYLRQIRRKERAFDPTEVRARVLGAARAKVSYSKITVEFEEDRFTYTT